MKIDKLRKASLGHETIFALQRVVPFSGGAVHMQRCHLDLFCHQCPRAPEEGFTMVELGQWVRLSVIPWKIELGAMKRVPQIVTGRVVQVWNMPTRNPCASTIAGTIGRSPVGHDSLEWGRGGSACRRRAFCPVQ
jgi:hypothetical protein